MSASTLLITTTIQPLSLPPSLPPSLSLSLLPPSFIQILSLLLPGGVSTGAVSDVIEGRAVTCVVMLVLAIPSVSVRRRVFISLASLALSFHLSLSLSSSSCSYLVAICLYTSVSETCVYLWLMSYHPRILSTLTVATVVQALLSV